MKSTQSTTSINVHFDACASVPLQIPTGAKPRPVRQGKLWPGETFTGWTHEWNLAGDLVDQSFVLPALAGERGSQIF